MPHAGTKADTKSGIKAEFGIKRWPKRRECHERCHERNIRKTAPCACLNRGQCHDNHPWNVTKDRRNRKDHQAGYRNPSKTWPPHLDKTGDIHPPHNVDTRSPFWLTIPRFIYHLGGSLLVGGEEVGGAVEGVTGAELGEGDAAVLLQQGFYLVQGCHFGLGELATFFKPFHFFVEAF